MPLLNIITIPHQTLRIKATPVALEEIRGLREFCNKLEKTMLAKDGLGLAANQVNVLKRIIVISTKDGPLVIINPTVSRKSIRKEISEEGCLSIPEVYGLVKRHRSLLVTGLTKKGEAIRLKATGLFARAIQHEVDHLNGILFIDRMKRLTRGTLPHENV